MSETHYTIEVVRRNQALIDLVLTTGPAVWATELLYEYFDKRVDCHTDKELVELAAVYWRKIQNHELK